MEDGGYPEKGPVFEKDESGLNGKTSCQSINLQHFVKIFLNTTISYYLNDCISIF